MNAREAEQNRERTPDMFWQERVTLRDGRSILMRYPRPDDLDPFLEFFNGIIEEDTYIYRNEPQTREGERQFLEETIQGMEQGEMLFLAAFDGERCVGTADIGRKAFRSRHIGEFGIIVHPGYRGAGLGRVLMSTIHEQAREYLQLHRTMLGVFANNTRAVRIYEEFGYKQCARIPERILMRGEYVDLILMSRLIQDGQ